MTTQVAVRHSTLAVAVYELLNPIPFGFFTAALIFDIIYASNADVLWTKSASWLIAIGLVIAIIPRLVNLVQIFGTKSWPQTSSVKIYFWLNLVAVVVAIVNAFVHSRDAYAVVPEGLILSIIVVALLGIANILLAVCPRLK